MQASPARAGQAFGSQLRSLRTRAGLTQEALAARAGLGPATLKALERGLRQRPHPHTVSRLAAALGLSATEHARLLDLASTSVTPPARTDQPSVAAARTDSRVRLPVPPTRLIGREAETAAALALLTPRADSARLVSLVGLGGVGKTRLAIAVAASLTEAFADGVAFVDLAPVADPQLAAATVARALGISERARLSAGDMVLDYLNARHMLLVLDNFEHLLEARSFVGDLLQRCPNVALLVTSRAPLRLQGERRVVVGPLAVPAVQNDDSPDAVESSPAVRLFVERARAATPDFVLDASNASAVASICRRLDGLALAIELAAARSRLMTPAMLLSRLERRLPLLTGGGPDLPRRQQTLRSTLEWSVGLLEPTHRAVLRALGVFAGSWSMEAAEAVAVDAAITNDQVLDGLHALVEGSLVHRVDDLGSEPRFAMLETVREYALEQLQAHAEAPARYRRHASYFQALSEQAAPELRGPDQRTWFDRLDRELDNMRVAVAWARSTDKLELGLRLVVSLGLFCEERGHVREGFEWLDTLMQDVSVDEARPAPAPLLARAEAVAAWLAFLQGDYERAAPLAEHSLGRWSSLGEVGNSPVALNALAYVALRDGDRAKQDQLFRRSLALTRATGDAYGSAEVLSWLGTQRRADGDLDGATALLQESLLLHQTTGAVGGIAYVLLHLGGVARARQDTTRARELFERSLALYASLGDISDVAYATGALAALAADAGDFPRAQALCDESIATFRQLGDTRGLTEELRLLGRIAWLQGDDRSAAAAYAECLTQPHALSRVEKAFCLEALALAVARGAARGKVTNQIAMAVRLLGAAATLREGLSATLARTWTVSVPEVNHPDYASRVAGIRATLGVSAFDAAWAAGRRLSAEQITAIALAANTALRSDSRVRATDRSRASSSLGLGD